MNRSWLWEKDDQRNRMLANVSIVGTASANKFYQLTSYLY